MSSITQIVCKSAQQDGSLSRDVVLPHESQEVFDEFRGSLLAALSPQGELERTLAQRIVSAAWRLRRVVRMETLALSDNCPSTRPTTDRDVERAFHEYLHSEAERLQRYEGKVERSFFQSFHALQRLQAARQGKQVFAPAVVDMTVSAPDQEA